MKRTEKDKKENLLDYLYKEKAGYFFNKDTNKAEKVAEKILKIESELGYK